MWLNLIEDRRHDRGRAPRVADEKEEEGSWIKSKFNFKYLPFQADLLNEIEAIKGELHNVEGIYLNFKLFSSWLDNKYNSNHLIPVSDH